MIASNGYEPDLLVQLKTKHGIKIDFFICEIKKPYSSSNEYESDFVKVHGEMKATIDAQVELELKEPICYSLLIEGFNCCIYQMTLKYEGEYRSRMVTKFRTLRNAKDVMLLLPVINVIEYLNVRGVVLFAANQ